MSGDGEAAQPGLGTPSNVGPHPTNSIKPWSKPPVRWHNAYGRACPLQFRNVKYVRALFFDGHGGGKRVSGHCCCLSAEKQSLKQLPRFRLGSWLRRRSSSHASQSSSTSRETAGAFGFLTFIQYLDRPEPYGEPSRLDTMPSQPSRHAARTRLDAFGRVEEAPATWVGYGRGFMCVQAGKPARQDHNGSWYLSG